MDASADIVVAGAGHNSLVAACYLAKAGYRCLVLDARHIPGGGAATEELLLPGFGIDTCATGHTLIRANPLLTRDELGLVADYGLRHIDPDPVAREIYTLRRGRPQEPLDLIPRSQDVPRLHDQITAP